MLVSILRNIGLATMEEQDEIDVLLEQQWKDMQKSEKLLVCEINLEDGSFKLETIDNSQNDLRKYLPGITKGSSQNYSPVVKINHYKDTKNKEFDSLSPEIIIKFDKITRFDQYKIKDSYPVKFGLWLIKYQKTLQQRIYDYFKDKFLTKTNKDELIVDQNAPTYLVFKLKDNDESKFIGEFSEFQQAYIERKQQNQITKKIKNLPEDSICMVCGEKKDSLFSLQACKYLDLFSLDQLAFQLQFQGDKTSIQALICTKCENLVRKGYNEVNSVLKFLAYKLKISEKETKYVYHSLIPLYSTTSNLHNYITNMNEFRKQYFEEKQKSFARKVAKLQEEIDKANMKKKRSLDQQIKKLEKITNYNQNRGILESSNDIAYLEILKEASARNLSFMDFFYQEERVVGQKKKIVEDVIYGDRHKISKMVELLETVNEKNRPTTFDLGLLMLTFGEKIGRLILQALFTEKTLNQKELAAAAYKSLWDDFRKTLINSEKEKQSKKYELQKCIKLFHYTIDLLSQANLLR